MNDFPVEWLWLFPATYIIHIAEESLAGERFFHWIVRVAQRQISQRAFLALNVIYLTIMLLAVLHATTHLSRLWLAPALGTISLLNGLGHLVGTLATRTYSPGLISGMLLWAPLGVSILYISRGHTPMGLWTSGIAVGILISAIVGVTGFLVGKPKLPT